MFCEWLRVLACPDSQHDRGGLAAFGEPFRGQAGLSCHLNEVEEQVAWARSVLAAARHE
jgi:hypothetical protein